MECIFEIASVAKFREDRFKNSSTTKGITQQFERVRCWYY
jgi:hypothetical protein